MNEWSGHLKITKQFKDGQKEVVFSSQNVITSGMGFGLVNLFSLSGSPSISDYQVTYFQLGVSGSAHLQVPETYTLSGALSSVSEYIGSLSRGGVGALGASSLENGVPASGVLVRLPFTNVSRESENSVRFTLVVDDESCNSLSRDTNDAPLNEAGLFMKNPTGFTSGDRSVLVAYRQFPNIFKTSVFSLIFEWTLTF